jgi:hypothetical protein
LRHSKVPPATIITAALTIGIEAWHHRSGKPRFLEKPALEKANRKF